MIRKIVLRRFKRFDEVSLDLNGHVVLAGPNNCGKTTILQAIGSWDLALRTWRELKDFAKEGQNGYAWAPIARPNFTAVSLRDTNLLWSQRETREPIEIEVTGEAGWQIAMQVRHDSREQVYVRPTADAEVHSLREVRCPVVFVPPLSGLIVDEGLWAHSARISSLLGQGRSGDVLRNLLVEASETPSAWEAITEATERLFGFRVQPPIVGASIFVEYEVVGSGKRYDLGSAGSGFLQVLLLITVLHIRPRHIVLLDEPDAHLHVILQDAIYGELRSVAARTDSLLFIATHSEVVINAVPVEDLWHVLDQPRRIQSPHERRLLADALGRLTNADVLAAQTAPGVLYVEDFTDLDILLDWATVLDHPARELLASEPFWKPVNWQPRPGAKGVSARDHFEALTLVNPKLRGLELTDGDGDPRQPERPVTGQGFQRIRWKRYEIESYLVHPEAVARFVASEVGPSQAVKARERVLAHFRRSFPPDFLEDPLLDHPMLLGVKARTELLPPALTAGGLPAFPYTRLREIALQMRAEEIPSEVREKLDLVCKAFGVAV